MTLPRSTPYIYVTWLSKLLAGEKFCEWAAWFQTHNKITKRPSDFDQSSYQIDHTSLLRSTMADLEENEYTISIEAQNYFELVGQTAKLAGRPDIIARRGQEALIIDGKTGEPRVSHAVQVMIYMWAIPKALPQYRNVKFTGMLIYNDNHTKNIPNERVDSRFVKSVAGMIKTLASDQPTRKVPSGSECGFCSITDSDCGDRVNERENPDDFSPSTDAF
jgi:CRISPR/Cas system-associated exonuclease Cas4 (RecB family)